MFILGVADGPGGGAVVVDNDRVVAAVSQARVRGELVDHRFPWEAIDEALRLAGASRADVDLIGVAGRFTPLLALRKRPWLRRLVSAPFSPMLDLQVFWQGVLRYTGAGAYDADVAAEWLDQQFAERGFKHARLVTVDVHRALAAAAYRLQPRDEALVITLHPMGDGVSLAVHLGRLGQLDGIFVQRGFASLDVHLQRAVAALGLRPGIDRRLLDDLAARGTVDPTLVRLLAEHLTADGPNLARSRTPMPTRRNHPVYARIAEISREDAAASILDNLVETVREVVRAHVRKTGVSHVALAGGVFEYPRLVAAVAELPEVDSVSALPDAGTMLLPWGAAATLAGLAPHEPELLVGRPVDEGLAASALTRAGLVSLRKASLVDRLVEGKAVLRFREREGPDAISLGQRCVLVRADDTLAIDRVRRALGRDPSELPRCLYIPTANSEKFPSQAALEGPLGHGTAAPVAPAPFARAYKPVVAPDGRAHVQLISEQRQPGLFQLMRGVLRNSGCGALAAFPIAEGDGPLVGDPELAVEVWRRGGFAALQLGTHYVERDA